MQKRVQCETPKEKKAVLTERKEALGSPINKVDRLVGLGWGQSSEDWHFSSAQFYVRFASCLRISFIAYIHVQVNTTTAANLHIMWLPYVFFQIQFPNNQTIIIALPYTVVWYAVSREDGGSNQRHNGISFDISFEIIRRSGSGIYVHPHSVKAKTVTSLRQWRRSDSDVAKKEKLLTVSS